ncbi:phosphatase PAP2 family protein [Micromonospora sp. MW-13]|uniref:phosphatase PAP2 family protein n=1 Tax=Micromonospora sp. MW-13 TaxID=2094022 RepID=UPI0014051CCF|nr:phosphatase PAP2 family protein [Micromonospora sp. MW-13]
MSPEWPYSWIERPLVPAPSRRPHSVHPGLLVEAALGSLLALALSCVVFLWTPAGQWLDGLLLPRAERGGGYEQQGDLVGPAKTVLALFGSPVVLAVLLGSVLLVGLARRRLVAGVVGIGMVLGAVAVAGVAKTVLPRPEFQIESSTTHNSFPSGHVTAATALLLAFMLVLPGWARRWLAVPGALGVSVVASATMIAGWHRFSDTLGGVLLAVSLFCLAAAALAHLGGEAHPALDVDPGTALWPDPYGAVRVDRSEVFHANRRSTVRAVPPADGDLHGRSDKWTALRGLVEAALVLVVLVCALLLVAPWLSASVERGPLVAIVTATALAVLAVGSVVFLVRSAEFAVPVTRRNHTDGARHGTVRTARDPRVDAGRPTW